MKKKRKKLPSTKGQRFGAILVLEERLEPTTVRAKFSYCLCDCGNRTRVRSSSLNQGITQSCGCKRQQLRIAKITKHGMFGTKIYTTWSSMKQRCLNPESRKFIDYGGRGITVCERWLKFENFYADMGDVQKGLSLDRINNDGNYEPGNCRWATPKQQSNNRRTSPKK